MKATTITKDNVDMLASRYAIDSLDIPARLPIGMVFITEFGNDETFEVITPEIYTALFTEVEPILNGFMAVVRK